MPLGHARSRCSGDGWATESDACRDRPARRALGAISSDGYRCNRERSERRLQACSRLGDSVPQRQRRVLGRPVTGSVKVCPSGHQRTDQENEHPRRPQHQGHHPGDDRRDRHVPHAPGARLRHADGRRRDAGEGRDDAPRLAGVRHGARGGREDWRDRVGDLRPAAVRRGFDPRGDRRRSAADRHDHRGHSGARHGQGKARALAAPSRG